MYIPKSMEVTDLSKQLDLIRAHPLGTLFNYNAPNSSLISYFTGAGSADEAQVDGEMCCTHVPFLVVQEDDGTVKLTAHMAAKNQHVQMLRNNPRCLVVFQAADSYITPSWYPLKEKTHKFVPTWDFAAVHVYGEAKIINDKEWLVDMISRLTDQEEGKRPEDEDAGAPGKRWKVSDAPAKYIEKRLDEVVGLEITVTNIQGKFKLQQDMSEINVHGVLQGLEREVDNSVSEELIRLCKENNPKAS
ncbi:hypothetical protein DAKH74_045260 [Maudiozyma humilis]|uniref:Negative transcriptional regulator n=1 Tax=Maudiozyma humilis TaxID=51915 RepID=A0AAV5S209_MAUHU|nr:hypothetical protein DAKH74_045260 [Kazachstania humilis]